MFQYQSILQQVEQRDLFCQLSLHLSYFGLSFCKKKSFIIDSHQQSICLPVTLSVQITNELKCKSCVFDSWHQTIISYSSSGVPEVSTATIALPGLLLSSPCLLLLSLSSFITLFSIFPSILSSFLLFPISLFSIFSIVSFLSWVSIPYNSNQIRLLD